MYVSGLVPLLLWILISGKIKKICITFLSSAKICHKNESNTKNPQKFTPAMNFYLKKIIFSAKTRLRVHLRCAQSSY